MKFQLSSRAVLLVIAALFLFPLILAWLMWNGVIDFKPVSVRNLGKLVQPPVAVDWENGLTRLPAQGKTAVGETSLLFSGHWVILHVVPAPCAARCLDAMSGLRQVHRASGRDQSRIRIALLLQDRTAAETVNDAREIYRQFQMLENPGGDIQEVLEEIAGEFSSTASGSSYLIDPIGNIMMFYEAGSDPNHLKKDLKRLLTWSKLDK